MIFPREVGLANPPESHQNVHTLFTYTQKGLSKPELAVHEEAVNSKELPPGSLASPEVEALVKDGELCFPDLLLHVSDNGLPRASNAAWYPQ